MTPNCLPLFPFDVSLAVSLLLLLRPREAEFQAGRYSSLWPSNIHDASKEERLGFWSWTVLRVMISNVPGLGKLQCRREFFSYGRATPDVDVITFWDNATREFGHYLSTNQSTAAILRCNRGIASSDSVLLKIFSGPAKIIESCMFECSSKVHFP
jgi:hypothetical protein